MYACIVFSIVHSRAHLRKTLTVRQTAYFMWVGVALTNAADSSIAHTPWKKSNNLKRRQE